MSRKEYLLPLSQYLVKFEQAGHRHLQLTFREIEEIIQTSLPASARKYSAWWSNNYSEPTRHCKYWLEYDWETFNLNLDNERIEFIKIVSD